MPLAQEEMSASLDLMAILDLLEIADPKATLEAGAPLVILVQPELLDPEDQKAATEGSDLKEKEGKMVTWEREEKLDPPEEMEVPVCKDSLVRLATWALLENRVYKGSRVPPEHQGRGVQQDKQDPLVPPVCQESRAELVVQGLLGMRDIRVILERLGLKD